MLEDNSCCILLLLAASNFLAMALPCIDLQPKTTTASKWMEQLLAAHDMECHPTPQIVELFVIKFLNSY